MCELRELYITNQSSHSKGSKYKCVPPRRDFTPIVLCVKPCWSRVWFFVFYLICVSHPHRCCLWWCMSHQFMFIFALCRWYHMVAWCCVFWYTPSPSGYMAPICWITPGYGPLSRQSSSSVSAELHSGSKSLWTRSPICSCFDTAPVSICLSLTVTRRSAPLPVLHTCTERTPVFAKGERERDEQNTTHRWPLFTSLFCFSFSAYSW